MNKPIGFATMERRNYLDYKSSLVIQFTLLFIISTSVSSVFGFISCSPSPCKNGGHCVSPLPGESYCKCTSKYVGEYCQHLNPCHKGPRCQNGGSCRVKENPNGTPSFTCDCPIGFSASLCEIPMDNACNSSPCLNGAACVLHSLEEYTCSCTFGFTGQYCERQDHCSSGPCKNGAECQSLDNGYQCKCALGFTGPTCADDINECDRDPCVYGSCYNTPGSYK